MAVTFPERVATRAQSVNVLKLILSVLMVPLYVVGFVVGALWLAVSWSYAALVVGFGDAKRLRGGG